MQRWKIQLDFWTVKILFRSTKILVVLASTEKLMHATCILLTNHEKSLQMGCPKEILAWTLRCREKGTDKVTERESQEICHICDRIQKNPKFNYINATEWCNNRSWIYSSCLGTGDNHTWAPPLQSAPHPGIRSTWSRTRTPELELKTTPVELTGKFAGL